MTAITMACQAFIFITLTLLIRNSVEETLPFRNTSLPWSKRVDDLVSRLTLEELIQQSMAVYGSPVPGIPRLNISSYVWITECLHGQELTNGTTFPQSIGLAASFDKDIVFRMTKAISYEVRAHWNGNKAAGKYITKYGLNCFSPVINIARNPLWGRNQETYGEDPYMSGELAESFVTGLQGDHPRYVTVGACCKHFDAYAGPENIPVNRFVFSANVTMRDWRMTFLPAFRTCVKAGVLSLMCSYNAVNGIPACAHKQMLTDILRTEWGFKGYVISDAGAVSRIQIGHHYTNSSTETAAAALLAGTNLELAGNSDKFYTSLNEAIKDGLVTERFFRESMKPLFKTRMLLGEFDPPEMVPFNYINASVIQSPSHRELAREAAQKTFTLLKNDKYTLPLKPNGYKRLAVVGPFGNNIDLVMGNYSPLVEKKFSTTPLEGLRPLAKDSVSVSGCDAGDPMCTDYNVTEIKNAVSGSDIVILCLGTSAKIESEGHDRTGLELPGHQLDVLKETVNSVDPGVPVILLLFNAGPVDITWPKLSPQVPAIMECYFPGQATGAALYNVLTATGPHSVPAGRLPMTWPSNLGQVPPITDYNMTGQTYRYYEGDPLYPFGYGLSYTKFEYFSVSVTPLQMSVTHLQNISIGVNLQNSGPYDAEEVVQVYVSWNNDSLPAPKLQLVGFKRVMIPKLTQKLVEFTVSPDQLALWVDDKRGFQVVPANMYVYAGGEQPNQRTSIGSGTVMNNLYILPGQANEQKLLWNAQRAGHKWGDSEYKRVNNVL